MTHDYASYYYINRDGVYQDSNCNEREKEGEISGKAINTPYFSPGREFVPMGVHFFFFSIFNE